MASSFEKSVKGGTKIKLAAPKSKYVEHILVATHAGEAGVAEIFRALQNRLRDSTWTIVFKGLILVHLMIREGGADVTLRYIAANPRKLAISNFSDVQEQGRNIRNYTHFLLERSRAYRDTKVDYVRSGEGRLKRLTVDKGLLRETEVVQHQIEALVKCDVLADKPENEITLTAFRLLAMDLLALFYVMNEGVINILEHFFEMSKYDAERALLIYKTFSKQTDQVVEYLAIARQYEHATRLEVPNLKHAPTSLTGSLEEYTQDPDFEVNRRQYLAQLEVKNDRGKRNASNKPLTTDKSKPTPAPKKAGEGFPSPKPISTTAAKQEAKGPAPDLIDFFDSIEQNQQPMAQSVAQPAPVVSQSQQPFGFQAQYPQQEQQQFIAAQQSIFGPQPFNVPSQQNNPVFAHQAGYPSEQPQPSQPNLTGTNHGAYSSQPEAIFAAMPTTFLGAPQNNNSLYQDAGFQQQQQQQPSGNLQIQTQQSTNPFRQSTLGAANSAGSPQLFGSNTPVISPTGQESSNPFARPQASLMAESSQFPVNTMAPAHTAGSQQHQETSIQQPPPFSTSTNPFLRSFSPPEQQPASLAPQPTGSTNPFRQSMYQNSQAGTGWQPGQGTMGGLEQLPTMPIFPRPGEPRQ